MQHRRTGGEHCACSPPDDGNPSDHLASAFGPVRTSAWAAAARLFHSADDDAGSPYSSCQLHHSYGWVCG